MKVVIHPHYGAFSLSREAIARLQELGFPTEPPGWDDVYIRDGKLVPDATDAIAFRTNPLLVQVVEDGLCEANRLAIVEVPDDVQCCIEEHDGWEWVAECHRTWYASRKKTTKEPTNEQGQ